MKLLVVNVQDPSKSKYRSPKTIGAWLWGRPSSNYKLFVVSPTGDFKEIDLSSAEITEIQAYVNKAFQKPTQMTPCEKLGYEIGDQFVTTGGCVEFRKGCVVELLEDSGSDYALFRLIKGGYKYADDDDGSLDSYINLRHVKKLPKQEERTAK